VRVNREGTLFAENYAKVTAAALDPLEKKPLKRFFPGKKIFSLGTFGCNLSCGYCQNWQISQSDTVRADLVLPEEAVKKAQELQAYGNIGLAYTYAEPLIWYEYVLDTARLARAAGLKNVLVTNGYINPQPLQEVLPYLDAVNLDIKSFTEDFYRRVCGGSLRPVLKNAAIIAESAHLEITTLLIPGFNDSPEEIGRLASCIAAIDKNIPLHLTRYFPYYKFAQPATSLESMYKARDRAAVYLSDVFLGNI
jgi:pyruvate formate lyase activating enzyme